jgi:hypothetical protein
VIPIRSNEATGSTWKAASRSRRTSAREGFARLMPMRAVSAAVRRLCWQDVKAHRGGDKLVPYKRSAAPANNEVDHVVSQFQNMLVTRWMHSDNSNLRGYAGNEM